MITTKSRRRQLELTRRQNVTDGNAKWPGRAAYMVPDGSPCYQSVRNRHGGGELFIMRGTDGVLFFYQEEFLGRRRGLLWFKKNGITYAINSAFVTSRRSA